MYLIQNPEGYNLLTVTYFLISFLFFNFGYLNTYTKNDYDYYSDEYINHNVVR